MHPALLALQRLAGLRISRHRDPPGGHAGPVLLERHRIYILPTRQGMVFAVILFTMLLGSLNYNNSMGFALTFLLAGIGFIAIHHTYRNLSRLTLSAGRAAPVFAGEHALFNIDISNPDRRERRALILQLRRQAPVFAHVAGSSSLIIALSQPAARRGMLVMERLIISTRFPLGLLCAWAQPYLQARCLVYPAPGPEQLLAGPHGDTGQHAVGEGEDDFAGQRDYRPGDGLRRVNWKAAARGQGLLVKEFSAAQSGVLWFDWEQFPELRPEARLSQLCRLVLDAEHAGKHYGLRLPDTWIAPGTGAAHRHTCLAALALFNIPVAR